MPQEQNQPPSARYTEVPSAISQCRSSMYSRAAANRLSASPLRAGPGCGGTVAAVLGVAVRAVVILGSQSSRRPSR